MAVRGTTSYVYFTDRPLGVGATGSVYFGRHKRRGDPCAIKVFRSRDGGSKELQLRQREFDVMSKLNHENIVKFIAIESESHGNDKVLIMELCTGGSVYKMLEDPENAFGFPEDEFLIFLQDITKALQYLRQHGVIHRDIKPGNILRYIKDDLGSVYKLTDFGAATELPENGEFMSLYGTEEYLHPDMYARALLGTNRYDRYPVTFNASVDLWSLGVTLYHVASGRLPFQPFGGRRNKEAMHSIISKKESGFISGVQQTKDGIIEWSRELPKTCCLSWDMKRLLVPILVGLLESEKRRQWKFEDFFHASKDITSRTVFHVFSTSNCSHNRLYLGRQERKSLTHFQEFLAEMTKIPASHQLLFHERWSVESLILAKNGETNVIEKTSTECPLFVIPTTYESAEWSMEICDLPKSPVAPPAVDISEDAAFARSTCAFTMFLHEKTKHLAWTQNSLAFCATHLENLLMTSLQEQQLLLHSLLPSYEKLSKLKSTGILSFSQFETQWNSIKTNIEQTEDSITKLSMIINSRSSSLVEFLKVYSTKICQTSSSCTKKQAHLVKELEAIKNAFKEHKIKEKDLSYNEQQIHKFDRGRASEAAKKSLELYRNHCSPNTESAWKTFQSYHSLYSKRKADIDQAEGRLRGLHEQITAIDECLIDLLVQQGRGTEKNSLGKIVETQGCTTASDKSLVNRLGDDDSAFVTGFKTGSSTAISLSESGTHSPACLEQHPKEIHLRYRITTETIPEEASTDSGIEMLTAVLKESLKDSNKTLKMANSTSDETDTLLNRICSSHFSIS